MGTTRTSSRFKCSGVFVAHPHNLLTLEQQVFSGKSIGTIFLKGQSSDVLVSPRPSAPAPMLEVARSARQAGLVLQAILIQMSSSKLFFSHPFPPPHLLPPLSLPLAPLELLLCSPWPTQSIAEQMTSWLLTRKMWRFHTRRACQCS